MARILIFTADDSNGHSYHEVYRDADDPTLITAKLFEYSPDQPPYPTYTDGQLVGFTCTGTTLTGYKYKSTTPFADYYVEYNSTTCGYSPTCDIAIVSFSKTDETAMGANDGTANLFCSTSHGPVYYQLLGPGGPIANNTGYFTGLQPGDFVIQASDQVECVLTQPFTIVAFDVSKTHYKYRLQFNSVKTGETWEVKLLDMYHSYDPADYPIDVNGTSSPLVLKQADPNEDKTTSIISRNVDINIEYDGLTFDIDEFALAEERQWKVEVYRAGQMEFQGWLLPDQTQNQYSDPTYPVTLQATDGLPSLKGNKWGDGSGGKGYSDAQVQQYGVTAWALLVKQCLDQLGYDYNSSILLSSLRYNGSSDWVNWGSWSDVLYDTEGVATDTYSALELLLFGMKLTIIQDKGQFVFINWNDMFYLPNGSKYSAFLLSLFEISPTFDAVIHTGSDVRLPLKQYVGYNQPIRPINPAQSLNYDKAYNIKNKIDFNLLALLYQNPSFEIGSMEGALPANFQTGRTDRGPIDYQLHNVGDLAYSGSWILQAKYFSAGGGVQFPSSFINLIDPIIIDQPNKLLNINFFYRANQVILSGGDTPVTSAAPKVGVVFTDGTSGTKYQFLPDAFGHSGNSWDVVVGDPDPYGNSSVNYGVIKDYNAWNQIQQTTIVFPESGIGTLQVYLFNPGWAVPSTDSGFPVNGSTFIIDFDQLELTLGDARDQYSKQVGEVHAITAVTGIPQANTKEVNSKLFTYPNNKRVSGNVFSASTYASGAVDNKWSFALKTGDSQDRLPATITKAIGRNYQRQFRIFEGDVTANYLTFYGIFILKFYEDSVFMPWSIEFDARNNTGHIIMVEISDNDQQAIYTYTPVFEKSARQVSN